MTSPPISRRETRRLDRRAAIMDVAYTSFMQTGYAGTTMSEIAAKMGGSKGTLWHHFSSKAELFDAVVDRAILSYREQLSAILAEPRADLPATLQNVCRSFLTRITSKDGLALHRLAVAEAKRFPEIGRIFYDRAPRLIRKQLAEFLVIAMEQGQLRKADPEDAARALTTLNMGGCHQKLLMGIIEEATQDMIEADATWACEIFLRAYAVDT